MIKYKNGCVLNALDRQDVGYVLHCCNAQGVMGSGIAKSIKERYPEVFEEYLEGLHEGLGSWSGSLENGIINIIGQEYYGRGKRQGHYGHIAKAFIDVGNYISHFNEGIVIGIPYKFASDRAGCDWEIILELIEVFFKDFEIHIYKL